jgi:hypothetical protein
MTIRKTLLASATLALLTVAGAASASAASMHMTMHPSAQTNAAISIQYRTPDLRDFRNDRDDRWNRRIVSDRVILANLRAHNLRAISQPRLMRNRIVVRAVGRFGQVVLAEFNPYTGRLIDLDRR